MLEEEEGGLIQEVALLKGVEVEGLIGDEDADNMGDAADKEGVDVFFCWKNDADDFVRKEAKEGFEDTRPSFGASGGGGEEDTDFPFKLAWYIRINLVNSIRPEEGWKSKVAASIFISFSDTSTPARERHSIACFTLIDPVASLSHLLNSLRIIARIAGVTRIDMIRVDGCVCGCACVCGCGGGCGR